MNDEMINDQGRTSVVGSLGICHFSFIYHLSFSLCHSRKLGNVLAGEKNLAPKREFPWRNPGETWGKLRELGGIRGFQRSLEFITSVNKRFCDFVISGKHLISARAQRDDGRGMECGGADGALNLSPKPLDYPSLRAIEVPAALADLPRHKVAYRGLALPPQQ